VVEGLIFLIGPMESSLKSKESIRGSSFSPVTAGRGMSRFSIHFVSSFPRIVISEEPGRFFCCPSLSINGKERVMEIKRETLNIFIHRLNLFDFIA
jgi:hypothetical protein